ncbi:MAG: hypothetical protein ABIG89_05640 [Candidatus Woesearchaeota archaeon]
MINKIRFNNIFNNLLVIVLVLTMLLFISCGSGYGNEKHILDLEFHKGTKGLDFEMFGLMPEFYEDTAFRLSVNLFNQGAYDIPSTNGGFINLNLEKDHLCITSDGKTCVSGDSGNKILIGESSQLRGKSILNPTGDFEIKDFYILVKGVDKQSKQSTTVAVTACYQYMTDLVTEVCLDPYYYDITKIDKPCEVKDLSFSGQGSPLSISNIETKMLSSGKQKVRPMFVITFQNSGNGKVINKDMVEKVCSSSTLPPNAFNVAHLRNIEFLNGKYFYNSDNIAGSNIQCDSSLVKGINLKSGTAKIVCSVKDTSENIIGSEIGTISTQMKIVVDYGYTMTESKKVTINSLDAK